jgi:capsular exopolysaccharide synthesis family protein
VPFPPPSQQSATATDGALVPYLRAVAAHKLLIAVVTLVTLAVAVAWLSLRTPSYESEAQILVSPLPESDDVFLGLQALRDSGDPTRTVQTAATLIESPRSARLAALRLGGSWTPDKVLQQVEVTPQGESNILAVVGRAETAAGAARLANVFVRAALDQRNRELGAEVRDELRRLRERIAQINDPSGTVVSELELRADRLETVVVKGDPTFAYSRVASPPSSPAGAAVGLVVPLALLAGLAIGSAAALLMELLDRRLRDEDEAAAIYPLPVLGRIPKLSRREMARSRGSHWVMPPAVREAFRTVLVQLESEGSATRKLMVTSATSGDGKSTSAVNLAVSIAAAGYSVALLDLDLRKPELGRLLNIDEPGVTLTALLTREGKELVSDLMVDLPTIPNLSVLAVPSDYGGFAAVEAVTRRLPALLDAVTAESDYVVIDTPPLGEVSDALRIASAVDGVLLVVRPGHTNRRSFEITRELLERTRQTPLGLLLIGVHAPSGYYHAYAMRKGRDELTARALRKSARAADLR